MQQELSQAATSPTWEGFRLISTGQWSNILYTGRNVEEKSKVIYQVNNTMTLNSIILSWQIIMLCHFLLMERSVWFWKAKEGKNDVAKEGHCQEGHFDEKPCQKAALQHCSANIINVKTALMNLDCPFLAAGAANVMYDMTPEHEARLSTATQSDIQPPLAGDGSSKARAEPPQTLLSQVSSRAEAPAPEGQLWHTRANSSVWGASGTSPSQPSLSTGRMNCCLQFPGCSPPLRDLGAPWPLSKHKWSCGLWGEDDGSH